MCNVLDSKAFSYRGWDKGALSECINPQSFSSFAQNLLTEQSSTLAQATLYPKHFPLLRDRSIFILARSLCHNNTALFQRNACTRGSEEREKGKKAFVEQFPYSTFSSCTYISSIHLYLCCGRALHWNISFSSPLYLQRKMSLKPFQFCWNFFWSDFSSTVCFHFFTEDLQYVRCLVVSRAPWLPKTMLL